MIVHLDCDVICYRAGYSVEHNVYHVHLADGSVTSFDGAKEYKKFVEDKGLGPSDFWLTNETQVEPVEAALMNVHSIIKGIKQDLQVTEEELRFYLSGPGNYRNGIATIAPYKGNRDPDKKPVHAGAIKALIRDRYGATTTTDEEADDAIGIAHKALYIQDPEGTVIATIDKDLDTVPGLHYNFVTKTTYNVSPNEARKFFWRQMLTGDTVDNIPGIKGIGPKRADAILKGWDGEDDYVGYELVRPLYVTCYGEEADSALLEMGRLLRIRQEENEWWQIPTKTT